MKNKTNCKKDFIIDFLGNKTYVGNTICVMVRLDVGTDEETLVFTVIEHIQGKFAHITVNGIKRFLEKGTFWIVKPSEISKLHPKCMTCKHLGRNTPFNIYEGCNKREAQNGGRLKGLRLLDPNKDYCSNHETNKD